MSMFFAVAHRHTRLVTCETGRRAASSCIGRSRRYDDDEDAEHSVRV